MELLFCLQLSDPPLNSLCNIYEQLVLPLWAGYHLVRLEATPGPVPIVWACRGLSVMRIGQQRSSADTRTILGLFAAQI